jgi:hypothetical protein
LSSERLSSVLFVLLALKLSGYAAAVMRSKSAPLS